MADASSSASGHGGSWARYFENKNTKLRQQFHNEERHRFDLDAETSSLFEGVTIFVNGHTEPSQQRLKHLMAQHGGGFEIYFNRPPVTHFICNRLPLAKIRQLRKERNPVPVVRPEWIVESIAAGKLLPTRDFSLEALDDAQSQRMESFLADAPVGESDDPVEDNGLPQGGDLDRELAYFRNADMSPSAFVQSYFEHSRLHFIGTWKMRIEAFTLQHRLKGPKPIKTRGEREIMHIDIDCFFASVALLSRPELKDVPFVVCHSHKRHGTAEISCANYPARQLGIHAGSFISTALEKCPTLEVVPYQFQQYQEISEQVYGILLRYSRCVEPVSCDEAYLDVTGLGHPEELAQSIRNEIQGVTRCIASAGMGPNKLVAKMATSRAKPNGQFRVYPHQVASFLAETPLEKIPGIGWSLMEKLSEKGIHTIEHLTDVSKATLVSEFGEKTGIMLWEAAHGIDTTPVQLPKTRRSVSAECNWGIRLKEPQEVRCYLQEILAQVLHRMSFLRLKCRCISLKVKQRSADAPVAPLKFLGCGKCDNLSRSQTFESYTDQSSVLMEHIWQLFLQMEIPIHEIRGLGITASKLDNEMPQSMTLVPHLRPRVETSAERSALPLQKRKAANEKQKPAPTRRNAVSHSVRVIQPDGLVLSDVDPRVLAALPEDLRREIVETIPLERDNLFVSGNNKLRHKKPKITHPPRHPGPDSVEALLREGYPERIPFFVESHLRAMLREAEDEILWCDQPGAADSVVTLLWTVCDWAGGIDEMHMVYLSQTLKAIRRLGIQFPTHFHTCSHHCVRHIQQQLQTQHGYKLDLGEP